MLFFKPKKPKKNAIQTPKDVQRDIAQAKRKAKTVNGEYRKLERQVAIKKYSQNLAKSASYSATKAFFDMNPVLSDLKSDNADMLSEGKARIDSLGKKIAADRKKGIGLTNALFRNVKILTKSTKEMEQEELEEGMKLDPTKFEFQVDDAIFQTDPDTDTRVEENVISIQGSKTATATLVTAVQESSMSLLQVNSEGFKAVLSSYSELAKVDYEYYNTLGETLDTLNLTAYKLVGANNRIAMGEIKQGTDTEQLLMGNFNINSSITLMRDNFMGTNDKLVKLQNQIKKDQGLMAHAKSSVIASTAKQILPFLLGNNLDKFVKDKALDAVGYFKSGKFEKGFIYNKIRGLATKVAENNPTSPVARLLESMLDKNDGIFAKLKKGILGKITASSGTVRGRPDDQTVFDLETHTSINTVIPGYLSKIVSIFERGDEVYFDYERGSWVKKKDIVSQVAEGREKAILEPNESFLEDILDDDEMRSPELQKMLRNLMEISTEREITIDDIFGKYGTISDKLAKELVISKTKMNQFRRNITKTKMSISKFHKESDGITGTMKNALNDGRIANMFKKLQVSEDEVLEARVSSYNEITSHTSDIRAQVERLTKMDFKKLESPSEHSQSTPSSPSSPPPTEPKSSSTAKPASFMDKAKETFSDFAERLDNKGGAGETGTQTGTRKSVSGLAKGIMSKVTEAASSKMGVPKDLIDKAKSAASGLGQDGGISNKTVVFASLTNSEHFKTMKNIFNQRKKTVEERLSDLELKIGGLAGSVGTNLMNLFQGKKIDPTSLGGGLARTLAGLGEGFTATSATGTMGTIMSLLKNPKFMKPLMFSGLATMGIFGAKDKLDRDKEEGKNQGFFGKIWSGITGFGGSILQNVFGLGAQGVFMIRDLFNAATEGLGNLFGLGKKNKPSQAQHATNPDGTKDKTGKSHLAMRYKTSGVKDEADMLNSIPKASEVGKPKEQKAMSTAFNKTFSQAQSSIDSEKVKNEQLAYKQAGKIGGAGAEASPTPKATTSTPSSSVPDGVVNPKTDQPEATPVAKPASPNSSNEPSKEGTELTLSGAKKTKFTLGSVMDAFNPLRVMGGIFDKLTKGSAILSMFSKSPKSTAEKVMNFSPVGAKLTMAQNGFDPTSGSGSAKVSATITTFLKDLAVKVRKAFRSGGKKKGGSKSGSGSSNLTPTGDVHASNTFLTEQQQWDNAAYIFDFLKARGWSETAICGLMGNMKSESTLNPGLWEGMDEGNSSAGLGLVQWTPATKLLDYAAKKGLKYDDMNLQLDAIDTDAIPGWIPTSSFPMSFEEFKHSDKTAGDLALAYLANYERPFEPYQPIRAEQAEEFYKKFAGKDNVSGQSSATAANGSGTATASTSLGSRGSSDKDKDQPAARGDKGPSAAKDKENTKPDIKEGIEKMMQWAYDNVGRYTYSMEHRMGPESMDCSSYVWHAMQAGGLAISEWCWNTSIMCADAEGDQKWLQVIPDWETRFTDASPPPYGAVINYQSKDATGGDAHTALSDGKGGIIHCTSFKLTGGGGSEHRPDAWAFLPVVLVSVPVGYAGDLAGGASASGDAGFDEDFKEERPKYLVDWNDSIANAIVKRVTERYNKLYNQLNPNGSGGFTDAAGGSSASPTGGGSGGGTGGDQRQSGNVVLDVLRVDSSGNLVDSRGNKISSSAVVNVVNNYYYDADGNRVDANGNRLDGSDGSTATAADFMAVSDHVIDVLDKILQSTKRISLSTRRSLVTLRQVVEEAKKQAVSTSDNYLASEEMNKLLADLQLAFVHINRAAGPGSTTGSGTGLGTGATNPMDPLDGSEDTEDFYISDTRLASILAGF